MIDECSAIIIEFIPPVSPATSLLNFCLETIKIFYIQSTETNVERFFLFNNARKCTMYIHVWKTPCTTHEYSIQTYILTSLYKQHITTPYLYESAFKNSPQRVANSWRDGVLAIQNRMKSQFFKDLLVCEVEYWHMNNF